MKTLEVVILSFNDWSYPWTFYEFVLSNSLLEKEDRLLFEKIWKEAGNFELWNYSDLILACKSSQRFIEENYDLNEKVVGCIVRGLSYQWR